MCVCLRACVCVREQKRERDGDRQTKKGLNCLCLLWASVWVPVYSRSHWHTYCVCVFVYPSKKEKKKKSLQGSMCSSQLHNPYSSPLLCQSQLTCFWIYLPAEIFSHTSNLFLLRVFIQQTCLMDSFRLRRLVLRYSLPRILSSMHKQCRGDDWMLASRVNFFKMCINCKLLKSFFMAKRDLKP